ncbi:MAG: DUF4430 domain-containing protein [Ruminococcus sp.]|nr:DUF4430 domain-containing protein [Ruminococcus sp.]
MKTKALKGIMCWLAVMLLSVSLLPIRAAGYGYTADEVDDLIGGIIAYKLNVSGSGSIQDWIDGRLTDDAGVMSEWYIIALSQYAQYDMSSYEQALTGYISSHNVYSATAREKYALALCAAGSSDSYITDILDSSIGEVGIMSRIYGLHLLSNGYTCREHTAASVVDELLSLQYPDGGWALFGEYGDIDVTAMTLQALAPYYGERSDVQSAVERGLSLLSEKQMNDGGYSSFGTPNPESSAQVLTALSALGIDCQQDNRFIKDGNTIIDGMLAYRLPDGSYCHISGGGFNETATIQAMYSLVAYRRMLGGQTPLYILDNRKPQAPHSDTGHSEPAPVTTNAAEAPGAPAASANTTASPVSSDTTSVSAGSAVSGNVSATELPATAVTSAYTQAAGSSAVTAASVISGTSASSVTSAAVIMSSDSGSSGKSGGYKPVVILIIAGAGAMLSLLLFALGKRSWKNFAFVGAAAAAGIIIVLVTDIRSPEEYYGSGKTKENAVGTVTMEIRCDTVLGKTDKEYIPDDGTILPVTSFEIEEGDTVYDVLTEAAQTYGLQLENKGSLTNLVYVSGINYLYELEFGELSGWVYHVNGISPSRGCAEYVLSDGDRIEWLYTCELGRDLNEVYE